MLARSTEDKTLNVIETFRSIQGEGSHVGLPCGFIRLATCNLRCVYCDTPYSFEPGAPHAISALLDLAASWGVRHTCVTGGEPMIQRDGAITLMEGLLALGQTVLLETHGALPLAGVPRAVVRVMDVKTPGGLGLDPASSKFQRTHFHYGNLDVLEPHDEVKFVLMGREDYTWAKAFITEHRLLGRVRTVLLSPSYGALAAADLAAWILDDQLPVRLNLQAHKTIWGADVHGV